LPKVHFWGPGLTESKCGKKLSVKNGNCTYEVVELLKLAADLGLNKV